MLKAPLKKPLPPDREELIERLGLIEKKLHEAENTLSLMHSSEKRYRRLFEAAQDGILILDAETGMMVDANPFLLRLLGYAYRDICGKHLWDIGVFKDVAASQAAFKTLQDNEYIRYEDLPLETADGKQISVEFISNVYLVDHQKVIQCNIRDITARKQGEAERKRLTTAIEQTEEAIVITDENGLLQFVNPAFETMTGYSWKEVLGQSIRFLNSGRQDEAFYRGLWSTISQGKTWKGRMINKRKDSTLYTEESSISPVCDDQGRIVNYVAIKRDITHHLRLMDQFQQAQKMEAVGILAGGMAHDYNNTLSVILGYAELALTNVDPSDPLHSDIKKIIKAALHSAEITRQLMAFARKQTIIPVVLELKSNIEGMFQMLEKLMGENIDLIFRPGEDICQVKMDPSQIDQILVNLCVNARDAIHDIGKVIIETGKSVIKKPPHDDSSEVIPGEYVWISVSDNGCGMSKDVLDHIFEPFYTSKGLGMGTGLGLSTVYGVVKQNNGFIFVDSEPGNGTTFKILLPSFMGQAGGIPVKTDTDTPMGRGETILVVEDEPILLKLNKKMLEKLGYHVLATISPTEALALAKEHANTIHLVLTDVVMPEMNGLDLSERLHSIAPDMEILFMSGYTADVIAHRGVLSGGVNFIQKPFSMMTLASKVRTIIDKTQYLEDRS